MDGLCFVLGVSTKFLRCETLKDLIYRSDLDSAEDNDTRKAKVTLVLAGGAGATQTHFSRAVDAAGASTYRIDGKTVQASAYQDRLEAIDILVKARNFLVFQGDVRAISRKKPAELTQLLEQVSGSDALKAEYEELRDARDRAKQNTVFNFQKRRGYNAEKKQVKAQVEEAEKFAKLEEELASARAESALFQLYAIERKVRDRTAEQQACSRLVQEAEGAMAAAQELIAAKRREQAVLAKDEKILEKRVRDLEGKLDKGKPATYEVKEKIAQLGKMAEAKRASLRKLEADHAAQQRTVADLRRQLETVTELLREAVEELARASKEKPELALEGEQVAEYERCREEAGTKTAAIRQEITQLTSKKTAEEGVLATATSEEKELRDRLAELEAKKAETAQSRADKAAALAAFRGQLVQIGKELEQHNRGEAELETARKEVRLQLEESTRAFQELKNEKRESKRDQQLASTIETLQRLFTGVRGRLVDLCKPTAKKYNTASTVALGRNMDAIVVDEERVALECIAHLRKERLTSATFIPLDTISAKPTAESHRNLGANIHLVIDVLTFDPAVKKAVQYAVGNTLVCDTLDQARKLCFSGRERYKAVTLDGTVIEKNGNMTGGAGNLDQRSKRWDEKGAEDARKAVERFSKELKQLEVKARSGKPREKILAEQTGVENRIKFTATIVENADATLARIDGDLAAITKRLREVEPAIAASRSAIDDLASKIAAALRRKNKAEDVIFKDFSAKVGVANIREYEEGRLAVARERQNRRLDLETQVSRIQNQLNYELAHDHGDAIGKLAAAITKDTEEIARLKREEEKVAQDSKKDTAEVDKARQALAELRAGKADLETAVREHKKTIDTAAKDHGNLAKKLAGEEAQLGQLRVTRADILRQCRIEEIPLAYTDEGASAGGAHAAAAGEGGPSPKKRRGEEAREAAATANATISEETLEEMLRHGSAEAAAALLAEDEAGNHPAGGDAAGGAAGGAAGSKKRRGGAGSLGAGSRRLDFRGLPDDLIKVSGPAEEEQAVGRLRERISQIHAEMERLDPNMKAADRFGDVQDKLKQTNDEFERAREEARVASERFDAKKKERTELFMAAFNHVTRTIDDVYKALTRSRGTPLGGSAYISLENPDEPFLGGIKFTAMPPMKRFRDMESLSGGEQTVASLALLFAIQGFRPSPFVVLDEVDSALDSSNVSSVASYVRQRSRDLQFIVISLKDKFYQHANSLVGIYRRNDIDSSRTVTLSLDAFDGAEEAADPAAEETTAATLNNNNTANLSKATANNSRASIATA
jgi:structural maintenance of chromosome 1